MKFWMLSYGFWMLLFIAVLFDVYTRLPYWPLSPTGHKPAIGALLIFALIILLGLGIYGPELHR